MVKKILIFIRFKKITFTPNFKLTVIHVIFISSHF